MRDALYRTAQEECAKIMKREAPDWRMASQGPAYYHDTGCLIILDLSNRLGEHRVFEVRTHHNKAQGTISTRVQRYFHNDEDYWEQQLQDRVSSLVIDDVHYRVHKDRPRGENAGFGGQLFRIKVDVVLADKLRRLGLNIVHDMANDVYILETRNLWQQGPIPPALRDKFPNNAEWFKEDK